MVTIVTSVRNSMVDAVVTDLNTGAGANAILEIGDTGFSNILIAFNMSATSHGAAASGTATANSLPITQAAALTGTAAEYRYKDKDGTVLISGTNVTVSGGGGEVEISPSLSITSATDYDLTSASLTQPAS